MKLHNKTINRAFVASIVILFLSAYGCVMFLFLHPLPGIAPSAVGDCIFVADDLPRNCRITGIDVASDDGIYLHAKNQTLCFDKNGGYLGRFVYRSQGITFFVPQENTDNFWILYGRAGKKFLCDPRGNVLQTAEMENNEYTFNYSYKQEVTDSNGSRYSIHKFLWFSRVVGPDGHTFYDQPVVFKVDCAFIAVSAASVVVFGYMKIKRKIGDESVLDYAIRGGWWK